MYQRLELYSLGFKMISYVITLSSEGSTLRAWNLPDGQMVWKTLLHSAQQSKSLLSVPGHMLKLKRSLLLASLEDVVAIQELKVKSFGKNKLTRDHNGFRKLILVLTRAGKLYALHTGDGRIVWSMLINSPSKSEACEHPNGISFYQWQVPHHHAMDKNPSVLVVGNCGSDSSAPDVLSFVDVYTGKELSSSDIGHYVVQVMPLPFTDSTEQRLHLVADTVGNVHLYPKTSEAVSIFQHEFQNVYWYTVDVDDGIIRGHVMKDSCS